VVRERSGENIFFGKVRENEKLVPSDVRFFEIKCIKFDFCWGFAPDLAGGAYSAPTDHLAALNIAP